MATASTEAPRVFSIAQGGPFFRLSRRVRLVLPSGILRVWWVAAVVWLPLFADSLIRVLLGDSPDALFLDISVHARFLVGLPLLIVAERVLDQTCRGAVTLLYQGELAERSKLDPILDRAERLRDTRWAEVVIAIFALAQGELVLWGITGPTGLIHGVTDVGWTFTRVWYAGLGIPVLLFLTLRWLWRWAIWTYLLVRLSRLPLRADAAHPDGAAGLAFLGGPVTGFAAFVLAFGSVLSGAWATQLLDQRVTVPTLLPTLLFFIVTSLIVACGPLVLFSGALYRIRRRGLLYYQPFALEYVRRFHARWLEARASTDDPLGAPDIQSLADLGGAYQVVDSTRLFVFGPRAIKNLVVAALLPMVPLIATVVPLDQLLRRMGSALLGVPL